MGREMPSVQAGPALTCHQEFDSNCLRCLQLKFLETTRLAKQAVDGAERWKVRALEAEALNAALTKREPLVQAIINFHEAIMSSARSWTLDEKTRGGKRMADLVNQLAEFKP